MTAIFVVSSPAGAHCIKPYELRWSLSVLLKVACLVEHHET